MKYLYLIWSNLKRHKLRSVLTMLSILVAFLLFGLLGAIRTAFTAGIDVADLVVAAHPGAPGCHSTSMSFTRSSCPPLTCSL